MKTERHSKGRKGFEINKKNEEIKKLDLGKMKIENEIEDKEKKRR